MASGQLLHIRVDNARSLDEEGRDRLARSLIAELNEHEPGVASLGRTEAPPGSKSGEWAMSAEVAISLGALVSSWAVPALECWLDRQERRGQIFRGQRGGGGARRCPRET